MTSGWRSTQCIEIALKHGMLCCWLRKYTFDFLLQQLFSSEFICVFFLRLQATIKIKLMESYRWSFVLASITLEHDVNFDLTPSFLIDCWDKISNAICLSWSMFAFELCDRVSWCQTCLNRKRNRVWTDAFWFDIDFLSRSFDKFFS